MEIPTDKQLWMDIVGIRRITPDVYEVIADKVMAQGTSVTVLDGMTHYRMFGTEFMVYKTDYFLRYPLSELKRRMAQLKLEFKEEEFWVKRFQR